MTKATSRRREAQKRVHRRVLETKPHQALSGNRWADGVRAEGMTTGRSRRGDIE